MIARIQAIIDGKFEEPDIYAMLSKPKAHKPKAKPKLSRKQILEALSNGG